MNSFYTPLLVALLTCAGLLACASSSEIEYDPPEVNLSGIKPPEKPYAEITYNEIH